MVKGFSSFISQLVMLSSFPAIPVVLLIEFSFGMWSVYFIFLTLLQWKSKSF